jgi:TatA/E family protein of Tat protein translocase
MPERVPLCRTCLDLAVGFLIALVGLLFFGKRLPELGRSLGKSIVEFKKGLKEIEERR